MHLTIKSIVLNVLLLFIYTKMTSQGNTGYLNFNLQNSTLKHDTIQQISIYGCNTSITLTKESISGSRGIEGPKGFKWKKNNQVVSGVPFGYQTDTKTKDSYYVSKYYIASPPVFQISNTKKQSLSKKLDTPITNTLFDIGLVTPDQFTFMGEKPVQLVYLDYSILKPMFIEYINIEFNDSFTKKVDTSLVNLIPFKVECNDFPWITTKDIKNAKGASGIGAFDRSIKKVGKQPNRLFLPFYFNNDVKKYLNCEVTLLNDIILNYELFFIIGGKKRKTINLKEYFSKHGNKTVKIGVKKRSKLPCGCKKPKTHKI